MADEQEPKNSALNIHPKVGLPAVVGSVAAMIILAAQQKFGIDLTGYEAGITALLMLGAGWLAPA